MADPPHLKNKNTLFISQKNLNKTNVQTFLLRVKEIDKAGQGLVVKYGQDLYVTIRMLALVHD